MKNDERDGQIGDSRPIASCLLKTLGLMEMPPKK